MDFAELWLAASRRDGAGDADPYPTLAWLRAEAPVTKVPGPNGVGDVWFVTSYDLVRVCLADPRLSSDPRNAPEPRTAGREPYILATDAPLHTRLRGAVSAAFSPSALDRLRPAVAATCRRHVAAFADRGSADLLADYAWYIPEEVISDLLGIPEDIRLPAGRGTTLTLAAALLEQPSGGPATDELWTFVDAFVTARRGRPGADLTGVLLATADRGELSMHEARGMAYVLYTTAQLTTAALLATTLLRVLADPAAGPGRPRAPRGWRPVVEETLRHASIVQSTMPRHAMTELELGGERIARGDALVLSMAAGNHDPDRFDRPDDFHAHPDHSTGHLGFGHGPHFCLGAALARLEAEIALDTLFDALPTARLAIPVNEISWGLGPMLRYPHAVPITFDPAPRH